MLGFFAHFSEHIKSPSWHEYIKLFVYLCEQKFKSKANPLVPFGSYPTSHLSIVCLPLTTGKIMILCWRFLKWTLKVILNRAYISSTYPFHILLIFFFYVFNRKTSFQIYSQRIYYIICIIRKMFSYFE